MKECSRVAGTIALIIVQVAGICCPAQVLAHREAHYHLQPGDEIEVQYRYSPEYDATVYLEPDGTASLPLIGDVKLSGLSIPEAQSLILFKADARLNEPEITVTLKDFQKPYYVVGGEVAAPGRFEIRGKVTAMEAVEIAGGLKETAKSSQVVLIRPVDGDRAETKLIDLKKLLNGKNEDEDIDLKAGDVLIVPKNKLAKVDPYVRLVNPGIFLNPFNF